MSNHISIAGTLGRDMELKFTAGGDPVGNFSVADSQGKDKPTIWHNCSLFGKRAESLQQYLLKGQSVTVFGQQTMREYTDKNGIAKQHVEIRVNDIALQGGKKESTPSIAQSKKESIKSSGFDNEDIPFANPYRGKYSYVY